MKKYLFFISAFMLLSVFSSIAQTKGLFREVFIQEKIKNSHKSSIHDMFRNFTGFYSIKATIDDKDIFANAKYVSYSKANNKYILDLDGIPVTIEQKETIRKKDNHTWYDATLKFCNSEIKGIASSDDAYFTFKSDSQKWYVEIFAEFY